MYVNTYTYIYTYIHIHIYICASFKEHHQHGSYAFQSSLQEMLGSQHSHYALWCIHTKSCICTECQSISIRLLWVVVHCSIGLPTTNMVRWNPKLQECRACQKAHSHRATQSYCPCVHPCERCVGCREMPTHSIAYSEDSLWQVASGILRHTPIQTFVKFPH